MSLYDTDKGRGKAKEKKTQGTNLQNKTNQNEVNKMARQTKHLRVALEYKGSSVKAV